MSPKRNISFGLFLSEIRSALSNAAWNATAAVARRVAHIPSRIHYRQTLSRTKLALPSGQPALSYGGMLSEKNATGGQVKLLQLQNAFPEQENFNILYLVNSALPAFPIDLVRWAKRNGVRVVWNQNGVGFPAWAGKRTKSINQPFALLMRFADHVVYQSEFCRESANVWLGKARCPSSVLFNPVDTREFAPAEKPPSTEEWQLLAAGTHYQPFRVIGALETLRCLRDRGRIAHLTIAGRLKWSDADTEVSDAINRLQLSEYVTLRPAFSQQEAISMFQRAHILLHLKYHDPCPTVAIEAMSCGVPVVASRSGGMAELIGNDGGQLLEVPLSYEQSSYPDPKNIAAAAEVIMSDWSARREAARARAIRMFSADQWVAAHAKIFSELV